MSAPVMRVNWFGRDPAAVVAAVVAALLALLALAPLSQPLTGALDGVVIAAGGVTVAIVAHADGQIAAILGLIRAGIAVAVVLNWHVTEAQITLVLAAAEAIAALFIRTQMSAQQAADGTWRNQITV